MFFFAVGFQCLVAQNYTTILYYTWANHVMPSSLYGNDVNNMMETPYGTGYNWWGKPLYAATHGDGTIKNNYLMYFGDSRTPNRGLINYHADLLAQGGIDFITIDFSNGSIWDITEGAIALCNVYNERMAAGIPTPQVAFFVQNQATLEMVEQTFFNVYREDMFFSYLDKKLVMIAAPDATYGPGDSHHPAIPTGGIYDNYTCRTMWGLDNTGRTWSFKNSDSNPPPPFYFNGQPEQMAAPVACQSSYMTEDGINPAPGVQGRQGGAFFNTYMDAAINRGVKFVFITEWNEWTAINFTSPPQGKFVDVWREEYSPDIEPMAGGHGDFYYQLMKQRVSDFKAGSEVGGIQSGQIYRLVSRQSGQVLDVSECSTADAANVQQWPWLGGNCQRWKIEATDNGFYRLISQQSGKALDVDGCSNANGANVIQWPYWGGHCQQWKIEPTDNGYHRLISRQSGQALDVSGCSTASGANVQQWPWNGGNCQQWKLEVVGESANTQIFSFEKGINKTGTFSMDALYPNPADEEVTFIFSELNGESATITILDIAGRQFHQQQVHAVESIKLNTSSLKAGIYSIILQTPNNTINKKLIVNH